MSISTIRALVAFSLACTLPMAAQGHPDYHHTHTMDLEEPLIKTPKRKEPTIVYMRPGAVAPVVPPAPAIPQVDPDRIDLEMSDQYRNDIDQSLSGIAFGVNVLKATDFRHVRYTMENGIIEIVHGMDRDKVPVTDEEYQQMKDSLEMYDLD